MNIRISNIISRNNFVHSICLKCKTQIRLRPKVKISNKEQFIIIDGTKEDEFVLKATLENLEELIQVMDASKQNYKKEIQALENMNKYRSRGLEIIKELDEQDVLFYDDLIELTEEYNKIPELIKVDQLLICPNCSDVIEDQILEFDYVAWWHGSKKALELLLKSAKKPAKKPINKSRKK